jgi:hypothetical protein
MTKPGTLAVALACLLAGLAVAPAHSEGKRFRVSSSIEVSKQGGLGQIEVRGRRAAVLQRDEGIVALLDVGNPRKPRVLGRYDDDARQSLDGDLAFSADGKWLFYARQTVQFSLDGLHVLDVSNPKQPRLAFYQPGGGTYRVASHRAGGEEWVVTLDATLGLVVSRFEPTTGAVVPVFVDPLPALKVGGPASAGVEIVRDPRSKKTLMYVSTGETGLQIYDFTDPTAPEVIGAWSGTGLAEIEVRATRRGTTVYAATEYWFTATTAPQIVVLDATKPSKIKVRDRWSAGYPADTAWRVQGMSLAGGELHVAYSHAGLLALGPGGEMRGVYRAKGARNAGANSDITAAPYAMDVDTIGSTVYLTDAATGLLTILYR